MIPKPLIIYLQTLTECNGHCRYCPFDDVYPGRALEYAVMSLRMYQRILGQLAAWGYGGRLGFLLHCEPTLDKRLPHFFGMAKVFLPDITIEVATNGLLPDSPVLRAADKVDVTPARSRKWGTSRAGNARACPENAARRTFRQPCRLPGETMCIAANGDVLLCCQDWRHEAVVGHCDDILGARKRQLSLVPHVRDLRLQLCRDCAAGRTFEEVRIPRALEVLPMIERSEET